MEDGMYVYQADLYCDKCGERIAYAKYGDGERPGEDPIDSDRWPVHEPDEQSESDHPDHCGMGGSCLDALEVDGRKVGCLLGTRLTGDGIEYVRVKHEWSPSELTAEWLDHFGIEAEEE